MKLEEDSSLHFVSLRMTDTYVFEKGVEKDLFNRRVREVGAKHAKLKL